VGHDLAPGLGQGARDRVQGVSAPVGDDDVGAGAETPWTARAKAAAVAAPMSPAAPVIRAVLPVKAPMVVMLLRLLVRRRRLG
jgi:hypothetical protein